MSKGFTLVELVLAIALLGFITVSLVTTSGVLLDAYDRCGLISELTQSGRVVTSRLSRELRHASGLNQLGTDLLEFQTRYLLDSDGGVETIRYNRNGTQLLRSVDGGASQVVCDYVTSFSPSGLALWSKLESDSSITAPTAGPGGVPIGTPTYPSGKFGNAMYASANKGARFPTAGVLSYLAGAVSFWVRPDWSSSSSTTRYLLDSSTGGLGERIRLWYDGAARQLKVGIGSSTPVSWTPTWSANQWVHVGLAWDSSGLGGSTKRVSLRVNGQERGSSSASWAAGTLGAYFYVGIDAGGTLESDARIDNLKVYGYPRTDVSDRERELASGEVAMDLVLSKSGHTLRFRTALAPRN